MLFISIYSGYTPKLYLPQMYQTKTVSKVLGVVNQVSNMGKAKFYTFKMQIYPRQFWCQKFKLIGQILTKLWPYVPIGTLRGKGLTA